MAPDAVTPRPEGGFTLIEVMIAMTLTALAILGIIALYATEMKASGFSRRSTEAAVLAEDKVEELRTGTAIAVGPTTEADIGSLGSGSSGIFTRTYSQVLSTSDYADITVDVTWADGEGSDHDVKIHARRNR